ncbi:spermine/spermidine synthase domain-containing protein [Paracidovorax citrulli]
MNGDPAGAGTVEWTEWLVPGMGTALRGIAPCASVVSAHQHIEIGAHPVLGHVFRLDGRIMSAEADAFIQHEIMVHPMALAHGAPARALVIGGGDGGSARELLRLPGMREIVVAELDPEVVALARRWLPGIHHGALDAPTVQWRFGDAMDTMAALRDEGRRFDLIVFDLTEADDGGPAMPLFADAGLALARACLAPGGALSMHLGPPFHRPASARMLAERLRAHFRIVRPMTIPIAAYGAVWAIAIASDSCDPCSPDQGEIARRLREWQLEERLRCYHAGLHHALFALPRHLQDVVLPAARVEGANPEGVNLEGAQPESPLRP